MILIGFIPKKLFKDVEGKKVLCLAYSFILSYFSILGRKKAWKIIELKEGLMKMLRF